MKTWKEIKILQILTWKTLRFSGRIYTPVNMADTLDVRGWAGLAWRKSDILSGMVEEKKGHLGLK